MAVSTNCKSQVLGRLDKMTYLPLYPHSFVPCHNLHLNFPEESKSFDSFFSFFSESCYKVSYPLPISSPTVVDRRVINGFDPVLHLPNAKRKWEDYKLEILKFCDKGLAEKCNDIGSKKKKVKLPLNVMLLANHLKKDPDPYLNANYNSYFNGTNMTCLDLAHNKFLIHPLAYGSGEIALSRLNLNGCEWEIDFDNVTCSRTGIPGPTYQIETNKDFVLTRQKQSITAFCVDIDRNDISMRKVLNVQNDCPIVSLTSNGTNFLTLSAKGELEMFDGVLGRSIFQENVCDYEELRSDRWGAIYSVNENTLSLLGRSSCGLIDLRVKTDIIQKWPIKDLTEHCEDVYTGRIGCNDLQYIVTTHQVFSLDFRVGFSQRWTHGISHSPAVISVLNTTLKQDALFIGSQKNDNVVYIENDQCKEKLSSKFHPYALPSLRDTFHLSQFNGCCLSNPVSARFNMSLTGLCCLENEGNLTLFRVSSIGDVFKQVLRKCPSHNDDFGLSESEVNKLEEWGEQCESLLLQQDDPCFVTDLLDDSNLLKCILNEGKMYEEDFPKTGVNQNVEWCVSKKELMSYCDYLAPRILEEWCIEDEEEWCPFEDKVFYELSSDDEDVTERVTRWIEKYAEDMAAKPSTSGDKDNEIEDKESILLNNLMNVKSGDTSEKVETDFQASGSTKESSSQKLQFPNFTPRKKFISGF